MFKFLGKCFFEGLLVIVPIALSVYIFKEIFVWIDGIIVIPIPGVGFAITIIFIIIVGFFASFFLTKRIFGLLDKLFAKLPFIKLLYSSIKDLIGAFVGDKKSFDKPVLVQTTADKTEYALGFVTREDLEFLGINDMVAVYFPQSYNFAGNLMLYPAEQVKPIDADSSDVMTFLVSGGVSGGERDVPSS